MQALYEKSERARLEKLRGLEVLDSPPERTFNRIARMTARVFGMPICAVSLVDEYRRWHKAASGLRQHKEEVV